MSAQTRQKRIPISCDPCRTRKIRCSQPRGPPPCPTCVRRGLQSRCQYAHRHQTTSPAPQAIPLSPISEGSALDAERPLSSASLIARVANLEALVQAQARATDSAAQALHMSPPPTKDRGTLLTYELGHVRFVPSTISSSRFQTISDPQQATCRSIDLSAGPWPLGRSETKASHLLVDLPPRQHCKRLKDIYFESFASLFHVLHDPTFEEQYAKFETDPESIPLSWLALLFAILGTSITALGPSSELLSDLSRQNSAVGQIAELSERYRRAALKCLEADNYLWQQNITTLQTLIVLIYSINHSHGQTWTLLGMAYHIALSLGCHIDPTNFGLDVVESEERRRCWASIMMLYTIQNTSLGHLGPNPSSVSEGDQMPSDIDDADLTVGQHLLPNPSGRPTQMTYFLFKFRLYHISDEVSSMVRGSTQLSGVLIRKIDQSIASEQQSWQNKYLVDLASAPLPIHHEVHLHILEGYSHQLTLLLHNHAMRSSLAGTSQSRQSVEKVLASAKELLRIHATFFTRADFSPFAWYLYGICSFHAYHAAASLIAILAEYPSNDVFEDIVPLLQQCIERFSTLTEASNISRKAVPVLQNMMDTIRTWSIRPGCQQVLDGSHTQTWRMLDQGPSPTGSNRDTGWSSSGHELDDNSCLEGNITGRSISGFDPYAWFTASSSWP